MSMKLHICNSIYHLFLPPVIHFSDPFLPFLPLSASHTPLPLLFLPGIPFSISSFHDKTDPSLLFFTCNYFAVLKTLTTGFLEKNQTHVATNINFLEKYPYNMVSKPCFFCLFFTFFLAKFLFFKMLVNRTISYLGYSSKPWHLYISLVLNKKISQGIFPQTFCCMSHMGMSYNKLSPPENKSTWLWKATNNAVNKEDQI